MTPDDPRHGSNAGYCAGCRETCCKRAHALDVKLTRLRKAEGKPRAVPALGAQRRIMALMALGWTSTDIGIEAGYRDRDRILQVLNGQDGKPCRWIGRQTYAAICGAFDRLSMRLPDMTPSRKRCRNHAARKGYLPPLAWDDIDNDPEPPVVVAEDHVDEVLVQRILDGERLPANPAERAEAIRRWTTTGRPLSELERITGWNTARELRRANERKAA